MVHVIVALICIFLKTAMILSTFTYAHYPFRYPCTWNACLSPLTSLKIRLSAFYLMVCRSYFYVLDIIFMLNVYMQKILSHSVNSLLAQPFLLDSQIFISGFIFFLRVHPLCSLVLKIQVTASPRFDYLWKSSYIFLKIT